MKKLRDAVVGDKIIVREARWDNRPRVETTHTIAKVNRVNLVASDGRLWNRDSGRESGSENQGGYVAEAEAWDEDMHPFLAEFLIASKVLSLLHDANQQRYRDRAKRYARALPYLKLAAKELGIEVPE